MDERQVRRVVKLVADACERIQELRRRRIGKMSSLEFWNALVSANKAINATDDLKAKSEKIALKHQWLNPDLLLSELGSLQTLIESLEILMDSEVLAEIKSEGYDANRIRMLVEKGGKMVEQAKTFVGAWENAYRRLLAGQSVKHSELSALEYKIAGMTHGLEDAIVHQQAPAVARVVQQTAYRTPPANVETRRSFLRRMAASIVLAGASAVLTASGTKAAYGQDIAQKVQELTDAEIAEHMKKGTVEEILKGANVEYVKYDPTTKATNYEALVFQKHLRAEERKPVLVFFYHNKDPPWTKPEAKGTAYRGAIVFRKLAEKLSGQIKFVCYTVDSDPIMSANNYDGFNKKLDILTIPSNAMYSPWDILKGETPNKHDGNIKRIDTVRGSPKSDSSINATLRNHINYWIGPNLLNLPNPDKDGKIYRYNNSFKLSEVFQIAKQ